MPIRLKQDRSRKSGHLHSQNIQDMQRQRLAPVELVTINITTSYQLLWHNLQVMGHELPPKLRSQLAVAVANLEGIVNGQ